MGDRRRDIWGHMQDKSQVDEHQHPWLGQLRPRYPVSKGALCRGLWARKMVGEFCYPQGQARLCPMLNPKVTDSMWEALSMLSLTQKRTSTCFGLRPAYIRSL